ncbi:MAG: ATP-binding cassette domain-containing protein [Bacteroidota bacterium]
MIEISDLHVRYTGSNCSAVEKVTTTIGHPTFTAVMGPNGAGKTALARCLNALITPTSGKVVVDGLNTNDPASRSGIRRLVGMVFSDPNLQITSVSVERELAFGLQNLAIPTDEIHARINEHLRLFGLEHLRSVPPLTLSGGEKQRLAIAAVTILRPRYLILDEATSLLGASSRRAIMQLILEMKQQLGFGLVLITQFPTEALKAERLIVMHQGNVLMDDTPSAIFTRTRELMEIGVPVPVRSRLMELL